MIEEVKTVKEPDSTAQERPTQPAAGTAEGTENAPRSTNRRPKRAAGTLDLERPVETDSTGRSEEKKPSREEIIERYGSEVGSKIADQLLGPSSLTGSVPGSPTEAAAAVHPSAGTRQQKPESDTRQPVPIRPDAGRHFLPTPIAFDMETGDDFFKYWASLSPQELDQSKVYPYRVWPKCDVTLLLSEEEMEAIARKEKREPSTNLGVLRTPFDPKRWRQEILHRYGAGDYHFKLNDVANKKKICMVTIQGDAEMRDLDANPPDLNHRTVLVNDPVNASYVRWCRIKGIKLPGINPEEESSMAEAVAVKALAGMAESAMKNQQQQPKQQTADAIAEAVRSSTGVMADAARQANEMVRTAMETARTMEAKGRDPEEYHKSIMTTAEAIAKASGSGNDSKTTELMLNMQKQSFESMITVITQNHQTVITLMEARQKSLEDRLVAVETSRAEAEKRARDAEIKMFEMKLNPAAANPAAAATLAAPPKTLVEQLTEMGKVFGALQKFGGGILGGGGEKGSTGWMGIVERLVDSAPNMLYNLALARQASAGLLNPDGSPKNGIAQPQEPDQGGGEEESQPGAAAEMLSPEQQAMVFLKKIEQPMIKALTEGATGQQFGALLFLSEGQPTYEYLASQSDDDIVKFLQNDIPIWQVIIRMPQRFEQFLHEFKDRPMVGQLVERMKMATQTPQPRTQPAQPTSQPSQPSSQPAAGSPKRPAPGTRIVHTRQGPVEVKAEPVTTQETQAPPQPEAPSAPASA